MPLGDILDLENYNDGKQTELSENLIHLCEFLETI